VILLDEIEKAHPEAFNMLLQIMEDGSLADAKGRRVDFRNTIIIMTSNIGAEEISRDMTMGFVSRSDEAGEKAREHDLMKDKVMQRLKQTFRPEFINRLDGTIVFHSLTKIEIRAIVDLEMDRVREQLKEQSITLEVTDEAKDLIGKEGYDHTYGARPLRRVIQNRIEDPLAEGLLNQQFASGATVKVDADGDEITLQPTESGQLVPA
jgi:ATP-dependent Clp protease ATP-binding subunit ClpC